ncbi:hypothetical protein [Sabulicella rubraurantiaca]|uniref:hypothetical protein n=1 Tax=Sabulicella rubraurantiaca TaxID=2811429 RepID=UPI001A96F331|nr:hypothetical protein [Sabulicella rubraurantiaca]
MLRHTAARRLALGAALGFVALAGPARAEGEGTNFMEDRVARILMEEAERARMPVCEAVLIPAGNNTFRIEYRVNRPNLPQVPRPPNGMSAIIATGAPCPR